MKFLKLIITKFEIKIINFSKLTLNFENITYGKWEQTFQNHIAMYKAK